MSLKSDLESLEQANTWLTRRLQLAEEQVREGEEVNINLTEENRSLKEAKVSLGSKLDELTEELSQLHSVAHNNSVDKQALKVTVESLRERIKEYKADEEAAAINADDLKCEVEKLQDIITSYCAELKDLTTYASELESKCESQRTDHELVLQQSSQALELKELEIFELRRQISDLESSNHNCNNISCHGESGDFILSNKSYNIDSANHSDAVTVELSLVEELKQQVLDKSNLVQELEMRLESVHIARQIAREDSWVDIEPLSVTTDMSTQCFSTLDVISIDGETQTMPCSSSNLALCSDSVTSSTQTEPDATELVSPKSEFLQQILLRCNDEAQLGSYVESLSDYLDTVNSSCEVDMPDRISSTLDHVVSNASEPTKQAPATTCLRCSSSAITEQAPVVADQSTNTDSCEYGLRNATRLPVVRPVLSDVTTQYDDSLSPVIQLADESKYLDLEVAYQSDAITECYILPGEEPIPEPQHGTDAETQTDNLDDISVCISSEISASVQNIKIALQNVCDGVGQIDGLISNASMNLTGDSSSGFLLTDMSSSDLSSDTHLSMTCYPLSGKIRRVDKDVVGLTSEQTGSHIQNLRIGGPRPIVSVTHATAVAIVFLLYALLFFTAFSGSGLEVRYMLQRLANTSPHMPPH